ncbi:MAG TPA: hypothetical protein VK452_08730 [Dissulfurispiraceae bacterium]|nr:hypothetical protein [Dissulfurispiraceae bacterium]
MNEAKCGVLRADINLNVANRLWKCMDSAWIYDWYHHRRNNPQYESKDNFDRIEEYILMADKPENKLIASSLHDLHTKLLEIMNKYLYDTALIMTPDGDKAYKIKIKRREWIDSVCLVEGNNCGVKE